MRALTRKQQTDIARLRRLADARLLSAKAKLAEANKRIKQLEAHIEGLRDAHQRGASTTDPSDHVQSALHDRWLAKELKTYGVELAQAKVAQSDAYAALARRNGEQHALEELAGKPF